MYCRHCGNKVKQEAKFCVKCGHPITADGVHTADSVHNTASDKADISLEKKKIRQTLIISIAILAALTITLIAVMIDKGLVTQDEATTGSDKMAILQNQVDGDYAYEIYIDSTAGIVRYNGTSENLTIPEFLGGHRVSRLGDELFNNNDLLKSVSIPNSVTSIGDSTFMSCSSLSELVLPDSLTFIGANAFNSCESLSAIIIPSGVKQISDGAFASSGLSDVVLPDGLDHIGRYAFKWSHINNIMIPDSVISIGDEAFALCRSLSGVILPENISSIGAGAFAYTPWLNEQKAKSQDEYIVLGNNAVAIYNGAGGEVRVESDCKVVDFYDCSSVTHVTFASNIQEITNEAFKNCTSLKYVDIPSNVKSIGDGAFDGCSALETVNISQGLISIGSWAFSGCSELTKIVLPDSVKEISTFTFSSKDLNNICVYCSSGSYADEYAAKKGMRCIYD